MKQLDTTVEEVLRKAIQDEVRSFEYYRRFSERIESPAVRKKLRDLSEQQIVHRARLERRYRELVGQEPPQTPPPEVDLPIDASTYDVHRVLKSALEHEREAESNYRFLAERAPDSELGHLFLELAEMEWRHKVEIQNEYDSLLSPDQFLLDIDR